MSYLRTAVFVCSALMCAGLVAGQGTPSFSSVTPNSGTGSFQTFTFQYSDTAGYSNLVNGAVLFNANGLANAGNSCFIGWNANTFALVDDIGNEPGAWIPFRGSGTLENNQCIVSAAGSSLSGSGNTLTVTFAITFKPGFAGTPTIYGDAFDSGGLETGWSVGGSWIVPPCIQRMAHRLVVS